MNALKLGMTLKTISSFDLSVNDEIWGVPVGTEFTFKESFTCPALYRHGCFALLIVTGLNTLSVTYNFLNI